MDASAQELRHYQNAVMNSAKWEHFNPRPDDIIWQFIAD